MKLEVEKQSFENKLTVYKTQQEERNRISADMHDDLGAGMTSIRLYSELAKSKMTDKPDMPITEIEKISSSADELINNMNSIIWSMSSQNDSMGNMVAYIRSYAIEYLENTGIKANVTIPDNLPELVVSGTIRRNVFLVIKEALQNVVKHSHATEVNITMTKEPEGFALIIHDNGAGIDFTKLRQFSNGLKNMRKRMQDINMEFTIENNEGTLVRLYAKTR
jgi:signal transduction histidine kinase